MTDKNLDLWEFAYQPPSAALKEVKYGRKFTSIDPYWLIRKATEQWGPIGSGWGYQRDVRFERVEGPGPEGTAEWTYAVCDLRLWYNRDEVTNEVCVTDMCELSGWRKPGGSRTKWEPFIDEEAPKKVVTGCISKALSYLGFGGYIFMGKHEGKYADEDPAPPPARKKAAKKQASKANGLITPAQKTQLQTTWVDRCQEVEWNATDQRPLLGILFVQAGVTKVKDIPADKLEAVITALAAWDGSFEENPLA